MGNQNSRKRALTGNAAYMADAIIKFVEGSFQIERHKMEAQEQMHNIQMKTNKAIAMKQMEMETRALDMEARCEADAMHLGIAELFSNNLHSTLNPTP